jgi:parallel beta-helix repeat protein
MDHVEIYNCSQWGTTKAAIRFESASTMHSSITNSAIHNGLGWGAYTKNSANINFANNVFYNFRQIGFAIDFSQNITVDGNVLIGTDVNTIGEASAAGAWTDEMGGFCICSYKNSFVGCTDNSIINNIAAGIAMNGFIVPGDDCDAVDPTGFKNNVAHSTGGDAGGFGALIYPTSASTS